MSKIGDPPVPLDYFKGEKFAEVPNEYLSGVFLDRSAHSLINRLVIRS